MERHLPALFAFAALSVPVRLPAQVLPSTVDICMSHDVGAGVLRISLRANDQSFGQVLSGLVFTIRWPEASPATLSVGNSAWCPPSQAFQPGPSATVVPGNGFKYKTWTATGIAWLSAPIDDGGCGQALLADTWTEVLAIPVNNDPGGALFELSEDAFTASNNRSFFISMNGEEANADGDPLRGTVCSTATVVEEDGHGGGSFTVAPNPSSGFLRLMVPDAADMAGYEVLDAMGRVVRRERFTAVSGPWTGTIDLQAEPAGPYLVRVFSREHAWTRIVVLERP